MNNNFEGQILCNLGVAVVKSDHSLWSWGNLLLQEDNTPKKWEAIPNVLTMDMWEGMYLIADKKGNIWYRGGWLFSETYPNPIDSLVIISKLENIQAIDCLVYNIFILKNDGTLWTFLINSIKSTEYKQPSRINGADNISKISKSLALKLDGSLFELSNTLPEMGGIIPGINDAIDLQNVWNIRTFILKKDGTVWGWGDNFLGVLGDGTTDTKTIPVQVKGLSGIVKISCNYDYNLALKNDGSVWFWGYTGVDSNNNKTSISFPQKIRGITDAEIICARPTSYFLKKDGSYWYYNVFTKDSGKILL